MKNTNTNIAEILLTIERLNEINKQAVDIQKILSNKYMKLSDDTKSILYTRLAEIDEEIDRLDFKITTLKNEITTPTPTKDVKILITLNDVNDNQLWDIYDLFNELTNKYKFFQYETVIDDRDDHFIWDIFPPKGYDDEEDNE